MKRLLQLDVGQRLSAEEALNQAWINDGVAAGSDGNDRRQQHANIVTNLKKFRGMGKFQKELSSARARCMFLICLFDHRSVNF